MKQNRQEIEKAVGHIFQPGKLVDITEPVNLIKNKWGLYNSLGLFKPEYDTQKVVELSRTHETVSILEDVQWDGRKPTLPGVNHDYSLFKIPHFPVQDMITPQDLDGNIDIDALMRGEISTPLTLQKVMYEKLERIRRAASLTLEFARAQVIRDGTVYAPNGTVVTNYYTEFGVTRDVINLDLNNITVNPFGKMDEVYGAVQDSVMDGDIYSDIVALCSPQFFQALVSNPYVVEAFAAFQQPQSVDILNQRLGTVAPLDGRYRVFHYGGIEFIEVRGGVGGQPYVTPGEAYVFPRGTSSFRTHYAPANKFASVNQTAQELYLFSSTGEKDDKIELEGETNFMNSCVRPQIIKTLTMNP